MKTIDVKDILRTQVTVIKTANGYENNIWGNGNPVGMIVPLKYVLYDLQEICKDKVDYVRSFEYHSEGQKQAKNIVPRYYISGVFDLNEYSIGRFPIHDYPKVSSNLMTIDIDGKDNPDIDIWKIREDIFKLPYVFSCIKSISEQGYYCIIPIEDTKNTKEYYNYILRLWKSKFGINIDNNASSLIRARIITHDIELDKWIKKDNVQVWNLKYIEKPIEIKEEEQTHYNKYVDKQKDGLDWTFICHKAIELLINDGYYAHNYNSWYYLGCECANFDDGQKLFIKASQNGHYSDSIDVIMKRWKTCKPSGIDNDLIKKWCGMARNKYGKNWFLKYINQ